MEAGDVLAQRGKEPSSITVGVGGFSRTPPSPLPVSQEAETKARTWSR